MVEERMEERMVEARFGLSGGSSRGLGCGRWVLLRRLRAVFSAGGAGLTFCVLVGAFVAVPAQGAVTHSFLPE
jgi:hypothetical protein